MIGFILGLIGVLALIFISFVAGAVAFALGAYEKIKQREGELTAKRFMSFLKED